MAADYRKHTDHSHNSSTYHKKDGTPQRAILKREAEEEIAEATCIDDAGCECPDCMPAAGQR